MSALPRRYLALLFVCAGLALPLRSEQTPSSRPSIADKKSLPGPMPPADAKKMPDLKKMDFSSLPADAVVIVCERMAEALQLVPGAIVLTPEKYQKMLDEMERLRKRLQAEKPEAPSHCLLKGKIEGNVALLEAHFEGTTERPNTLVALACPQASAASADLEGRVPQIHPADAGGFVARIEKAGCYHLKLDLFVPLSARESNGRGFELTLPRAAINNLDLELPPNARDARVGSKTPGETELAGLTCKNHRLAGSLGTVEKVEIAWKEIRPPSGVPVLLAQGDIKVRLDAAGVTTEAQLTLRVEGAPTNVWHLLAPPKAEVQVAPADAARVSGTLQKADRPPYASLYTIHLKEPSAEPLRVQVKVRSPLPANGALVPIGPFFVVDAARQTGAVQVRNTLRNLHLDFHKHGDMTLRQVTEEPGGDGATVVTAFTYGNMPQVAKPQSATGPNSLSWLDLEGETLAVRGPMRTRVTHTLTLRNVSPSGSGAGSEKGTGTFRWDIVTTIAPASKWTEGETLKILAPPGWTSDEDVQPTEGGKDARFVVFRSSALLREGATQAKRLQGHYDAPQKAEGRITLQLPWPRGTVEQCDVKLEVPRDSEVVLGNAELADLEPLRPAGPNDQTWRFRRVPPDAPALDLKWGSYRPELIVKSVVDLTLDGGRGEVRQEIHFHSPRSLPRSLGLRVPAAVGDSLLVVEGGSLLASRDDAPPRGLVRWVTPAKTGTDDCRLVLQYSTTAGDKMQPPRPGQPFTVPLVTPEQATRGETRVRLWSAPAFLPLPAGTPPWDERKIEEVKDRSDLPVLVLQAPRVDAPLVLRAGESSPVFAVLPQRAMVRVQLLDSGGQAYRVSYQLRHLAGEHLDVELPGPVPTVGLQVALNRRRVTPDVVDGSGRQTDSGNVARLRVAPELVRQTALLELSYQLPPGRTGGSPLRSVLHPPKLLQAPPTLPTRWEVSVPANRVLIAPESEAGLERTWTRRGWLLAARLRQSEADLERDFEEALPAELRRAAEQLDAETRRTPALVCWRDGVEPIVLTHAPKQGWLLVCSLALLVAGMGLYGLARPRPTDPGRLAPWFWPFLALAALGAAVGVLFWPTTFWAVVYGCEPGTLVLLCVVGFQWLMHQRYRRQIVFLPSFSRSRAGSSLLRKANSHRPQHGEPSTVDAPPPSLS